MSDILQHAYKCQHGQVSALCDTCNLQRVSEALGNAEASLFEARLQTSRWQDDVRELLRHFVDPGCNPTSTEAREYLEDLRARLARAEQAQSAAEAQDQQEPTNG